MRLPFTKPKAYNDTSGLDATTARIWIDAFGGTSAKSGTRVDANTALFSNAITACLAVRSRTLSALPVHVYRVGTRQRSDEHPSAAMFRSGPNEYMTWSQFMKWREMMLFLTGNAYCAKRMSGGRVVGLDPLNGTMTIQLVDGKLSYRFKPISGSAVVFAADSIVHFKWDVLTADGLAGRSVVELAREAIGLDIDAEAFLARILANGTHMGVVLRTDNVLTDDQVEQLKLQLADGQGITPAGKARVFQNGLKPEVLGMNVQEADLEVQRRYVNEKISAICGVPLSLLNDLTHGTYTNTEQQNLNYSVHHIAPSVVEAEQTFNKSLFVGNDAGCYYVKFSLQALQRGDFATRMAGYETGIRIGLWSPNECREWEDMDPYDGGDVRVMQAQMVPVHGLTSDEIDVEVGETQEVKEKVEAVTSLVRSGYDPLEACDVVGLPRMAYLDVQPVTVRPLGKYGEQLAPADPDQTDSIPTAAAALAPLVLDTAERIKIRARIDTEKKRDSEETREWARTVIRPLAVAHELAGMPFDAEAIITSALGSQS